MAPLTHACGYPYEPGEVICGGCLQAIDPGRSIQRLPTPPYDPTPPPPTHPNDAGGDAGDSRATCRTCGRTATGGQLACLFCGTALPQAGADATACARLLLPGGLHISVNIGDTVILGRHSPNPDITAALSPCDAVSRRHAELRLAGRRVQVTDLGSTNGTFLDGRLADPTTSAPLDGPVRIGLGREITLLLRPDGNLT